MMTESIAVESRRSRGRILAAGILALVVAGVGWLTVGPARAQADTGSIQPIGRPACVSPHKGEDLVQCHAFVDGRGRVRPDSGRGGGHGTTTTTTTSPPTFPAVCSAAVYLDDYSPWDLECAYNLQTAPTGGVGQTVVVVDAYDDPNAESDLGSYRSQFRMPACTTADGCFRKLNEWGQASSYPAADNNGGWELEESLDLDMVSAACPNCRIVLVEAASTSFSDMDAAENAAASLHPAAISDSWGANESNMGSPTSDEVSAFNHPGIQITASAGDNYFGDVEFPAALSTVTAVGGTNLDLDSSGQASRPWSQSLGWDETAWSVTSSGCSQFESKPSWQMDLGCPLNRMVTDVAAVANPKTGVQVYDSVPYLSQSGPWWRVGGTSVGAPFIAGVYALAGNTAAVGLGWPYSHANAFYDITSGSNAGNCIYLYECNAGPGYDGPTGLGTPNGTGGF